MTKLLLVYLLVSLSPGVLAGPDEDPDAVPSWIISINPTKMTDEQRTDILWEEKKQRKRLQILTSLVDAGSKTELSKIPALDDLGRVLYKLEKFDDALEVSREVAEIYAREYGKADRRTISAFINVASTLNRLGSVEECHTIMKGMFPAQLDRFGIGSKEVSFHIGILAKYNGLVVIADVFLAQVR